jgi:superfamily II DNA helicase RecQ
MENKWTFQLYPIFPRAAIATIIPHFEHLSTVAMPNVFGKMPYPWQLEILSHLSLMKKIDTSIYPGAVLLVRPTGGGKSSVREVYSVMCACVSLTITLLLSLWADQTQKIWQNTSTKAGGPLHADHLDDFLCPQAQQLLSDQLILLLINTNTTVFIFSSPQAIVKNQVWHIMVDSVMAKRLLSRVCINEVHLFVQLGLTFHQDFALLQPVLFKKLQVNQVSPSAKLSSFHTTVPVLFMTATCNQTMVEQIKNYLDFASIIPLLWNFDNLLNTYTSASYKHV